MDPTQRIVVGVDHSDHSRRALRFAAEEAARRDDQLEVVWAWDDGDPPSGPWGYHLDDFEVRSWAQRQLEQFVSEVVPDLEQHVVVRAVPTKPTHALMQSAEHAHLVVVGSRGRGGFAGLRLGSVSLRMAAQCPCPIVIVPEAPDDASQESRIVVGVDGSEHARTALRWALGEGAIRGEPVVAVHGWGPPPAPAPEFPYTAPSLESIATRAALIADEAVDWASREAPGVEVTADTTNASGAAALVTASSEASLVVVGSRGLGPIVGLVFGSTTQQVVRHATCPVAVIPEGWGSGEDRRRDPLS